MENEKNKILSFPHLKLKELKLKQKTAVFPKNCFGMININE